MYRSLYPLALCLVFVLGVLSGQRRCAGQSRANSIAAIDVDDADFQIQGEYVGPNEMMHVIARGDGKFEIVVYEATDGKRRASDPAPRRMDGDKGKVLEIAESIDARRVVRDSPTLNAKPPSNAVVLFDGSEASLDNWVKASLETSPDGRSHLLMVGTRTKQNFRDYRLHLEFRTPFMPTKTGQKRGNSGVYHQARYETQILDSFGLKRGKNDAGSIYDIKAPDINACLPPMQWQTYDVEFTAARFDGDRKISDARMTVRLNGVIVQNDIAVPRATRAAPNKEDSSDGPIYLQNHGDPVRFRNIWLVPRDTDRKSARPNGPGR
ncbi:MAG: DUF1080 domain-containing protein [Planctomycetota bacterium]